MRTFEFTFFCPVGIAKSAAKSGGYGVGGVVQGMGYGVGGVVHLISPCLLVMV